MAIATNGLQLARLAGAVFNQQLSAADYSELLTANKTATELNAWANGAVAAQFKGKTTTDIAKEVLANLGLTQPGLDAWLAGQLTAGGGVAKAGETMLSLLNDFSNMTADATFGASATTFNAKAAGSQALSQTAGTATGTYAAVSSVVVNTALTLTSATQTSTGTAGDDTFTAAAGTWGTGDVVNGGTGTDTLNATITGTGPTQSATSLVGVEVLNVTASPNPSTLDLTGVTGLTQVNNVSSANGATLSVTGLGNVVNTTITGGNTSTSIAYTTAAVASTTADAATLTLKGTAAGSSFTTSGIETLTINSGTSANTLASLSAVGMTKLVVTGDQALTIGGTTGNSGSSTVIGTTTFDLSAATGALTLTTGNGTGGTGSVVGATVTGPTAATAGALTLTTGSATGSLNDTVTLGAGTNTVTTNSGNDTITSGGGANTITPGTGNDTINAGAGVDTIRFADTGATHADTINSFGATDVIAVNLGAAAVTGTSAANASASTAFGVVPTGATSPVLQNVGGTATANAVVFQAIAPGATATVGTVAAASNVIALNGAYTDGTATGVVSALGSSAGLGITTAATGKFLLVTYSVGNIAQVWSYAGDTTVNTDIDIAELALVATLNGVALNGLTAANFSTYLTPVAASTTVSNAGQTFNLSLPLNTVTSVANSAGQFFTAGADTVTSNVGALATAAATSAQGTTLIDSATGDGDSFSASVLAAAWDAGTILSNIETVNLTMLAADAGLIMSTVMPGTTTLNVFGAQNMTGISSIISGTAFGLGAGYTGNLGLAQGATLAAATLNLNGTVGTSAATSPTFSVSNGGVAGNNLITALTVNANATTTINADAVTTGSIGVFNATTATLNGTGNVTVFGPTAEFNTANIVAASPAYSGTLTFRPSAAVVGSMDFTTTGVVTGLKGLDLSDLTIADPMTNADTVLLPAATGGGTFTVTINPTSTTAVIAVTGLTVTQGGSALNDAMTVAIGANATLNLATAGITATGTETLTITNSGISTTTTGIGGITLADGAGSQAVTVSGAGNYTLGTVIADSLTTTGVTGTVSATLNQGQGGSAFTGGAGATTITGTNQGDNITTGAGNDIVSGRVGADVINVGIGTDNVILAATSTAAAGDAVGLTVLADSITGFAFGTGNDVLQISATLGHTGEALVAGDTTTAIVAAAAVVVTTVTATAGATLAAGSNVIYVSNTLASSAALLAQIGSAAVGSGLITVGNADPAANREYLIVWQDGVNTHVGIVRDADTGNAAAMVAAELTYGELALIVGSVTAPVAANFVFIT